MTGKLLEITADIVQTQAGSKSMSSAEIVSSLRTVFQALWEMQGAHTTGAVPGAPEIVEEAKASPQSPAP